MLGEATVKASRIMMVMKGDTLVYNAAAFQLSEGSMLDQLVRQLPGVELRDGGRIYVNGRYANSVDFVSEAGANGQRSSVRTLSVGETLRFAYRYGQVHVGAQARASYTRATSRRTGFATINCVDFDYDLTLTAPLVWDIELATDLTLFSRRGYDDASMNDNCLVWNASLARSFGRKKDWTLRADGFDILRQLSSVRRTLTAQGRTETWYNTVPSYFMVRLMYRIHVLPKRDRKAD